MNKESVIYSGISIVATLVLTAVVGSFMGVFARGTEALTEDQIKKVLTETLVLDSGDTYGMALTDINGHLLVIDQRLNTMERALGALTTP